MPGGFCLLTKYDTHGKMLSVPCETEGGLLLKEEVMTMTITLMELIAILALLVEVISLCYRIFSEDK